MGLFSGAKKALRRAGKTINRTVKSAGALAGNPLVSSLVGFVPGGSLVMGGVGVASSLADAGKSVKSAVASVGSAIPSKRGAYLGSGEVLGAGVVSPEGRNLIGAVGVFGDEYTQTTKKIRGNK